MRCDVRDAMRRPIRCELVAMQCAALRCTVRGAGGAMLFSYAIEVWADGWAEGEGKG